MRPAPLQLEQKSSTGESSFERIAMSPKQNTAMTPLNATILRSDSTKSTLQRFGVFKSKDMKSKKNSKCLLYVQRGYLHIKHPESKQDDIVLNVRGCSVNIVKIDSERNNSSRKRSTSSDDNSLLNYAIEISTHSEGTSCVWALLQTRTRTYQRFFFSITGEKIKLKIGSESMRMLHSIRTLILLATVPAMTFIPGRMLKAFEAVGAGTSATVYKATYAGATVALKRLSASFSDSQQVVYESMIAEIQLLTQLRHPNVVNFLGICYNSKSVSREQEDDVDVDSLQIDLVMDFYPLCLKNFLYVEFTCGSWRIMYHMCTPFIHMTISYTHSHAHFVTR